MSTLAYYILVLMTKTFQFSSRQVIFVLRCIGYSSVYHIVKRIKVLKHCRQVRGYGIHILQKLHFCLCFKDKYMYIHIQWCSKSDNSVLNQILVSKIGLKCPKPDTSVQNRTLVSKIGHQIPRSDTCFWQKLDTCPKGDFCMRNRTIEFKLGN